MSLERTFCLIITGLRIEKREIKARYSSDLSGASAESTLVLRSELSETGLGALCKVIIRDCPIVDGLVSESLMNVGKTCIDYTENKGENPVVRWAAARNGLPW